MSKVKEDMNTSIERTFVKSFICKRMQNRLIFELSTKNRNKAITRFAHISDELIESKYVIFRSNKLTNFEVETKLLEYCDKNKKVYIISSNKNDGEFFPLGEAIQLCMDDYMPSIVIVNQSCVFIKEETEYGAPMKYILLK